MSTEFTRVLNSSLSTHHFLLAVHSNTGTDLGHEGLGAPGKIKRLDSIESSLFVGQAFLPVRLSYSNDGQARMPVLLLEAVEILA